MSTARGGHDGGGAELAGGRDTAYGSTPSTIGLAFWCVASLQFAMSTSHRSGGFANFAVKSSVWASCQAADAERENAEKRDLFRRCIAHTERGGRWLTSLPDQLPGCPRWVRLLTMFLGIVVAGVVAMLPGMDTAVHVELGSRTVATDATYSFPLHSVRAIAVSLDRGKVTFDVAGTDSSSGDVAISVLHSVGPTAESSLSALSTTVKLDESSGVLTIIGVWDGGAEDAFAAPAAELALQLNVPSSLSTDALSIEVRIDNVGTGFAPHSSGDQALSIPWRGFVAPEGDIIWEGDFSSTFGRVSLSTIEGSITAKNLRAVEISAASDHGTSISLERVAAHILTVASGVATIDAEVVEIRGRVSWPTDGIQLVAPDSTRAGGLVTLSTASASSVRLRLGSGMGDQSGRDGATTVEVDCGTRIGATCTLEVPDSSGQLCGSIVARSEPIEAGAGASIFTHFPDTSNNGVAEDAYREGFEAQRTAELTCSGDVADGWIRGSMISRAPSVRLQEV